MLLLSLSLLAWFYLFIRAKKRISKGFIFRGDPALQGCGGDDNEQPPAPPARPTAEQTLSSSSYLQNIQQMLSQLAGKSVAVPSEWGTAANAYQQLLDYSPEQFQYPMADIQSALEAQQAQQYQQYLNQIRPTMAAQGQLDSSYYANMISDYLKGQQTQSLGNTANLLTNQAQQNYALQTWLPQFKQNVASSLAGLGGQQAGLQQWNLTYPYQNISGLESLYGVASGEANQQYQDLMNQYNYALSNWQNQQNQAGAGSGLTGMLGGTAVGAGLGALLAPFTGGLSLLASGLLGAGIGGAAGSALGSYFSPSYSQASATQPIVSLSSALNAAYPQNIDLSGLTSSRYNPQMYDLYSTKIPSSSWN